MSDDIRQGYEVVSYRYLDYQLEPQHNDVVINDVVVVTADGIYHRIPNAYNRELPDKVWFYPMHRVLEIEYNDV